MVMIIIDLIVLFRFLGETHSVREFVDAAFQEIGKQIIWEGEGLNEIGKEKDTGIVRVVVNPKYFRPTEVVSSIRKKKNFHIYSFLFLNKDLLIGNPKKAEEKLKWKPKTTFKVIFHCS